MKPSYRVSAAAIELIKRFEGLRLTAEQLDDGRWTIGYGHTRSAREGAAVSEADAEALLTYDLVEVQAAINDLVFTPLTQNQFDALAAFVFNIGVEEFRHSSVLRRLNEGALLQAACAMEMWRKADFEGERIIVDALVRRRATEKALFLTPEDGFVAMPSGVLQPKMDYEAAAAVPRARTGERLPELKTSLDHGAPAPITSQPAAKPQQGPSFSERAAAAVTARLKAILPDEPDVNEPEPFPSVPPPALASAPPIRSADPAAEAAKASVRSIFDQTRDEPEKAGVAPLAILGAIGFALFVGGLYWAFVSKPSGGPVGLPIIGFLVGILGIICIASAAYFLLERLGFGADQS
jgi:lysozyme